MKLIKIIYSIVAVCIATVAILLLVSTFPITGNVKFLTVLSGSMEPTIHTGSVVVIKPAARYKVNDIVTSGRNSRTQVSTTHRIVSLREQDGMTLFTTKGDANNASDIAEIRMSDIQGKVLLSLPNFGYVINFIRKPAGLIIIVVIPAFFIIFDEVRKIIAEIGRMKTPKI